MKRRLLTAACLVMGCMMASAVSQAQQDIPRQPDGKPDISGIWQSLNNANWNLEDQVAEQGPVTTLGAIGAVPPGKSVVVGGNIPYRDDALAQREANFASRRTEDPEAKCFMPGIPRATYIPQPFQIFQTDTDILMAYQFAGAVRTVYMEDHMRAPIDSWMGWSNGRWEGDTLVIEVGGLNSNWLDRSGNYYTNTTTMTERYTLLSPYHMLYEVTVEDPAVYERPWQMSMPLYKRIEDHARLFEFKCPEFAEEILYDHLTRENYFRNLGIELDGENDE
jgi:hypothetical protein